MKIATWRTGGQLARVGLRLTTAACDKGVMPMTAHADPQVPQLLTSGQVAALFRVGAKAVNRWADTGLIPSVRTRVGTAGASPPTSIPCSTPDHTTRRARGLTSPRQPQHSREFLLLRQPLDTYGAARLARRSPARDAGSPAWARICRRSDRTPGGLDTGGDRRASSGWVGARHRPSGGRLWGRPTTWLRPRRW